MLSFPALPDPSIDQAATASRPGISRGRAVPLLLLLLLAFATLASPADPGSITIAAIDGQPITLRELEDAALKQEGAEEVEKWVTTNLEHLEWPQLKDDDVLLQIGFNRLTRRDVALALLNRGIGKVREELIQLAVVRSAIAKAGIVITPQQEERTWRRMKTAKETELERQAGGSGTKITFENWLQVKENKTPEQFRAEPGFQLLAGLHALVAKRAAGELTDEMLRPWFNEHHARYDRPEAVRLRVMHFPFRSVASDGSVSPEERERCRTVAIGFRKQIQTGQTPWETLWPFLGKPNDGSAGDHGDVGWVPGSGRRTDRGRSLPPTTMEAAFAITAFPTLLGPLPADDGMDLVLVLGHQTASDVKYEDVRDLVREDRIEVDLDARTSGLLIQLMSETRIDRVSLPGIINQRMRTVLGAPPASQPP